MNLRRVVFYCESPFVGGHERMALNLQDALSWYYPKLEVRWALCGGATELRAELDQRPGCYELLPYDEPLSLWRSPLRTHRIIQQVAALLGRLAPDIVVVIQGGILLSLAGVLAARRASIPVCSYLPMINKISYAKSFRFPVLVDWLTDFAYRAQDRYITLDAIQAGKILQKNARAKVWIVENYVPRPAMSSRASREHQATLKRDLGVAEDRQLLLCIGRIEFPHKQQDWLLDSLSQGDFLDDKFLLFVGDGTDAGSLDERIGITGGPIRRLEWQSDTDRLYCAADVVVIPSCFEGVPLVMLEALSRGIPVVGSDVDGMRDWLPVGWRFAFHRPEAMREAILQALAGCQQEAWGRINAHLESIHDFKRLADHMVAALVGMSSL